MIISAGAFIRLSAYEQQQQVLRGHLSNLQAQHRDAFAELSQQYHDVQIALTNLKNQERNLPRTTVKTTEDSSPIKESAQASETNSKTLPKYSSFRTSSSIKVRQHIDGSLTVEGSDPAHAGKLTVIEAVREDGSIESIPVTIPP